MREHSNCNRYRGKWFFAPGAVFLLLALVPSLFAQEAVLVLDPDQTRLEFVLADVLHTVHGHFRLKEGTIRVDLATGDASGVVIVDAASGNSGNTARDRKMHTEILESQKYPDISISPVRIVGHLSPEGESRVEMRGLFKIHGAEHEISMAVSVQISGDRMTAAAHFIVPYAQWGMKSPSTFLLRVSDKVEIDLRAEGRVTLSAGRP
jgi:polyisoprenoid-binding protein YceI